MKILVGSYQCESNSFAPQRAGREAFHCLYGEDAVNAMAGCRLLRERGVEILPMPYAVALPSGEVKREDYLSMLEEFLAVARANTDADGVYLYFHGAMCVEGLGSGEEYFVARLREVLGGRIPISVACDFHAIVTDAYAASINALPGFRTAPHTDYDETEYRAVRALLRILDEGLDAHVTVARVPVLLADAAQTAYEPYATLLQQLSRVDGEASIVAASIFNGQPWVDSAYTGACIALSYTDDGARARELATQMASYFWEKRGEIRFTVPALSPDATLKALPEMPKPVFISDSGDNSTAGADGRSTFLLGKMMGNGMGKVLFASILAPEFCEKYSSCPIGTHVRELLPAPDAYSRELLIDGELVLRGRVLGFVKEALGEGILVRCGDTDVLFTADRTSFLSADHFKAMGIDTSVYDAVVLKIGYLWPEVAPLAASTVFCFTPGTSTNDFSTLQYRNLKEERYYVK